jgi:hypothetical protein
MKRRRLIWPVRISVRTGAKGGREFVMAIGYFLFYGMDYAISGKDLIWQSGQRMSHRF